MGRPAPSYWWDFNGPDQDVIVQGDWPGGEELARFKAPKGQVGRELQIAEAEQLIADYKAGRAIPSWWTHTQLGRAISKRSK